jgi:ADP-ribosylglycohydrolase
LLIALLDTWDRRRSGEEKEHQQEERKRKGDEEQPLEVAMARSFASRLCLLFAAHKVVGCGLATTKAVTLLLRGTPYDKAGSPVGMAGNSPAVRAACLGLFCCQTDRHALLLRLAVEQSVVTHQDARCCAGAVAMAVAVREAMRFAPPLSDKAGFAATVADAVRPLDRAFALCISRLCSHYLPLHRTRAKSVPELAILINREGLHDAPDDGSVGVSGFVVSSVIWALFCFLLSPDNLWQTLGFCMAGGGDADSTCAMALALSGAHLGAGAIPRCVLELVHDQDNVETGGWEALAKLARRAWDAALRGEPQAAVPTV